MSANSSKKAILIIFLLVISGSLLLAFSTDYRARTDEDTNLLGVESALATGHINGGYISGDAYESFWASTLLILGFGVPALSWLSPLSAGIIIATMCCIGLAISRRMGIDSPLVPLLIAAGLLATPDVVGYFRQSSHAAHTHAIFATAIFIVVTFTYRENDNRRRWSLLLLILGMTQFIYNYVWATLFWIILLVFLLRQNHTEKLTYLVGVTVTTIIFWYPSFSMDHVIARLLLIRNWLARKLGLMPPIKTSSEEGLSFFQTLTKTYDTFKIGGLSINSWFVYGTGEFIVATLTFIAFTIAIYQITHKDTEPFVKFFVMFCLYFGMIFVSGLAVGELVFIRRLIPIPAFLGLIYISHRLVSSQSLNEWSTPITVGLIVLLMISAPLGAQRVIVGDYANPEDVAAVDWASEYSNDCLSVHDRIDRVAAQKRHHITYKIYEGSITSKQIYSASDGPNSSIFHSC